MVTGFASTMLYMQQLPLVLSSSKVRLSLKIKHGVSMPLHLQGPAHSVLHCHPCALVDVLWLNRDLLGHVAFPFAGVPARLAQAQLSLQMRRVVQRAQSLGSSTQKDDTDEKRQSPHVRAREEYHVAAESQEGKAGKAAQCAIKCRSQRVFHCLMYTLVIN